MFLLLVLSVTPPGSSVPLTLSCQWLHHNIGIFQQSFGVVFDNFHPILQLFLSRSASGYSLHRYFGSKGMANLVLILVYCAEINGVLHVHILAWIYGKCFFNSPTVLIFQCTVLLTSMWWLCICIPVLLGVVWNAILPNILPKNNWQPRWNLLGDCRVSTVPEYCLRDGINTEPCVGQGNNVIWVLIVGFHIPP